MVATVVAEHRAGVSPLDGGYLSDLGASGNPGAGVFRLGLVAAAAAHLGVAVSFTARLPRHDPRVLLLLAAAVSLGSQTVVRCTGTCRLPGVDGGVPLIDAAHLVVAGVGFALWAAVAAIDVVDAQPIAPRVSPLTSALLVGHLALLGGLVLIDPHGTLTALLQRTMVLVALTWLAWSGVLVAFEARARSSSG